ncbi:MAG: hypothetical protein PHQ95_01360 [Candidatus Gracilibacteria bacterium]|nr:hypothetical protein [Candidatus Gracilibacteria bacterium]
MVNQLDGTKRLVAMTDKTQKQYCLRILLAEIKKIESVDAELSLELQAAWLDACKKFGFYDRTNIGKCSASNIEAFKRMVEDKYPDIYEDFSETDRVNVSVIQDSIHTRSQYLLDNGKYRGPDIGPTEILEHIINAGFKDTDTFETELLTRTYREHKAPGYISYFNQFIVEHFTEESIIKEFFNGSGKSEHHPRRSIIAFLEISTILVLVGRLTDWTETLMGKTSLISAKTLINKAPKSFLRILANRGNKEDIQVLSSVIEEFIVGMDSNSSKDVELGELLCQVVGLLEDKGGDHIKSILADYYPASYLSNNLA